MQTQKQNRTVQVKDYLLTVENLYFAVVSGIRESGRCLCGLRYAASDEALPVKFDSDAANRYLAEHFPHYLFHSKTLDVPVHGVRGSDIRRVLRPSDTVNTLMTEEQTDDTYRLARSLIHHLSEHGIETGRLGITGSVMLGFHGPASDIDFVVYGAEVFGQVRKVIRELVTNVPEHQLDPGLWEDSYKRRNCELDFGDYRAHELRKFNKLNWHGTKVDFSCVPLNTDYPSIRYPVRKSPARTIRARIKNDQDIFSFPARYVIDHADIREILSYTATYTGQAFRDESIEAHGPIETDRDGVRRMIIGTSREAKGEYLRVLEL